MSRTRDAGACLRDAASPELASRVWLQTDTRAINYGELALRIRQTTALLAERGVALGDRVIIGAADDGDAAVLFLAMLCNGVTAVVLDPATRQERARALIAKAQPKLAIVDQALRADWALAPDLVDIVEIAPPAPSKGGLLGGLLRSKPAGGLAALLDPLAPAEPPREVPPETLAYILFTSGTTREPKGVCISHRALFSHLATLSRVFGYSEDSRILNTLMLSHADGMIQGPAIAFFNGARLYRPMKFGITAIDRLLDAIYQLRISHMVSVPTMLALMTKLAGHHDQAFQGGDFRLLISCGAALEPALWRQVEQGFGVPLINVYGLTETVVGGVFAGGPMGAPVHGEIGTPVDCELKIVDDAGAEVADGSPGELLMRGDLLMSGYFADPQQTAEVMIDGWFHTGDIARRDSDGRYWICGRKKNIVIRGGLNIHPEEIAEALNRHPKVADAVAFGEPDPDWGEKLYALVASESASEAELLEYCAQVLEPRKIPSRIAVVAELPKGRSGKVMIEAARELFERPQASAPTPGAAGDVEQQVLEIAARVFKIDRGQITLSSRPDDVMGWDSLAHLDFVVAIEEAFGVTFKPREIMAITEVSKAVQFLKAR